MSSTVLAQEHFVPQIENNSYYYNEKTGKTYFKVFLINNKVNKRKFKIANLKNMHKDVDGYENLPITLVQEGPRKGNHPNPKDANIFEANYQNKYSYVTKAIEYYRNFGVAKIVKIFKPDPNLLTASNDPIVNYFALAETDNQNMINILEQSKIHDQRIYVSPAMFSWDWIKDPVTKEVSVNSFVPTHLAIVDSPAYDPEIAYIKKQTCQKDGMSCYYELFEASDLENLNNDSQQTDNMSSNKFPSNLEEYVKSYWSMDVVDTKNVNAEDLTKNPDNYIIIDKSKANKINNGPQPVPIPTKGEPATATNEPYKGEPAKAVPAAAASNNEEQEKPKQKKSEESKSSFTLEDVKALLAEQKNEILASIKAEQTKGERETLLDTYMNNEKIKEVKDKIDQNKLKEERELYNSLPLDNEKLKFFMDRTIYNPKVANPTIYTELFAVSEQNREIDQKDLDSNKKNEQTPKPQGAPKDPAIPKASIPPAQSNNKPITEIPAKPNTSINMYGTEFKNSADSSNKYNDNYNGKDFNASKSSGDEYHPTPTTGEGTPKRFQKYIQ